MNGPENQPNSIDLTSLSVTVWRSDLEQYSEEQQRGFYFVGINKATGLVSATRKEQRYAVKMSTNTSTWQILHILAHEPTMSLPTAELFFKLSTIGLECDTTIAQMSRIAGMRRQFEKIENLMEE